MYWLFYFAQQMANYNAFMQQSAQNINLQKPTSPETPIQTKTQKQLEIKTITQGSSLIKLTIQDLNSIRDPVPKKLWSQEEDALLQKLAKKHKRDWNEVSKQIPGRNPKMCYSRFRRLQYSTKNTWKKQEQSQLLNLVEKYGLDWKILSQHMENRTPKQIKQHYLNYLRPDIDYSDWSIEDDLKLVELLNIHGKNWKKVQSGMPNRTQNQVKNRYFGKLRKLIEKKQQEENNIKVQTPQSG